MLRTRDIEISVPKAGNARMYRKCAFLTPYFIRMHSLAHLGLLRGFSQSWDTGYQGSWQSQRKSHQNPQGGEKSRIHTIPAIFFEDAFQRHCVQLAQRKGVETAVPRDTLLLRTRDIGMSIPKAANTFRYSKFLFGAPDITGTHSPARSRVIRELFPELEHRVPRQ